MNIKRVPLHYQILIGMIAGVLWALCFPQQVGWVIPLGNIFIKLLKMLVVPLIFVSIVDGIARVANAEKLSQLGFKTLLYYMSTNFIAVIISLILVNVIQPGRGVEIFGAAHALPETAGTFSIIPDNFFRPFVEGNSLQIILIALLVGIALVLLKEKTRNLLTWFSETNELLLTLTDWVIRLAPLGVFGLLAGMTQSMDWKTFIGIGKFSATILISLLIHGVIVLPLLLRWFSDRRVGQYVKAVEPALLTAFSTSSSSATLPLSLECVEKKAGVPKEIAGFVLPVGATVNMDGTAIYEAAACLFVAQAVGVELSLFQQLIVFFTASLAAVGAAAIPSAGLVTLVMVLNAVGLPLEGIGFLLAIDRPLDMSRTVVNVWGDMVGCAVVEGKTKK